MKKYSAFLFLLLFFALPAGAQEGGISVSPLVIDEEAKAGDIMEYIVRLKNSADRQMSVYAAVFDVVGNEELVVSGEPALLDKASSLAGWVSIQRSRIEVPAGGEVEIPLRIKAGIKAEPGKYFGAIGFYAGSNREDALANGGQGENARINLGINIMEDIVEKMNLISFKTSKSLYFESPIDFEIKLNNTGNREMTPKGRLYIYSRRGELVEEIDINPDNRYLKAGGEADFNAGWDNRRAGGKYKARLEIEYGEKKTRDLQDTLFFWILPKTWAIFFSLAVLLSAFSLSFLLYRLASKNHEPSFPAKEVIDLKKNKAK